MLKAKEEIINGTAKERETRDTYKKCRRDGWRFLFDTELRTGWRLWTRGFGGFLGMDQFRSHRPSGGQAPLARDVHINIHQCDTESFIIWLFARDVTRGGGGISILR